MKRALGIDIGGTKIALGLVASNGESSPWIRIPTESSRGVADTSRRIAKAAGELQSTLGLESAKLLGVGIGCPGPLNPEAGTIHNPYTLPGWEGADLRGAVSDALGVPALLLNDADAALLGEHWRGSACGVGSAVMLTFGTGVGGAAMVASQLVVGCGNGHPEFGHIQVDPSGPECYCGTSGCLEAVASGPAIAAAGKSLGFADTQEVFLAAYSGSLEAKKIIEAVGLAIERACWNILHTYQPDVIVLGGGIMESHYGCFGPRVERRLNSSQVAWPFQARCAPAKLGNAAGILGAAASVFRALPGDLLIGSSSVIT